MPESASEAKLALASAIAVALAFFLATSLDLDPPDLLMVAVAAITFACGRYAGLYSGAGATLALLAALAASGDSVVPFLFVTGGPWVAGRVLHSREELLTSLARRTRELELEQDALARLSVSHERARIARELHDIVAHHLAVIVIQAGAGRLADDDDETTERFASIRRAGDEALAEMSHLVDLLQPPENQPQDTDRRLEVLLEQAQAAGLRLRSKGVPIARLQPEIEQLAYRIVQEGLTNAMKHAPGSDLNLRIAVEGGTLDIDVHDSGGDNPGSLSAAGSGLGLEGLRDRVESLGGRLDAGPEGDDGWRLRARVPVV